MEYSTTSSHEIGSDMLFEILSRSSLNTLSTFKTVSKEYNSLNYDSGFLNLHSSRTNNLSGFLLYHQDTDYSVKKPLLLSFVSSEFQKTPNSNNNNINLDFLPSFSAAIIAPSSSSQGILVCADEKTSSFNNVCDPLSRYFVCKPVTKEWQQISNPKIKFLTVAIGIKIIKSKPLLHYKIVRFSLPKPCSKGRYFYLICEIFDSVVGKWRRSKDLKLPFGEDLHAWNIPAVSVCGKFHWRTYENKVFAFDLEDEKYDLFALPFADEIKYGCVHLTDYEGKLGAIIRKDGNFFEMWVMEVYKKKEWKRRMRISTESIEIPVAFCNSDVALVPDLDGLSLVKFKEDGIKEAVRILDSFDDFHFMAGGVYPFRSDFKLCGLKNDEKIMFKSSSKMMRRNNELKAIDHTQRQRSCLVSHVISPTFVCLFMLFLFTLVCFVLDI